jgi:hypothetical protein
VSSQRPCPLCRGLMSHRAKMCRPCKDKERAIDPARYRCECGAPKSDRAPRCWPCSLKVRRSHNWRPLARVIQLRPRCVQCRRLPQKRDELCVMCAPPEPGPSLEVYATRGWCSWP